MKDLLIIGAGPAGLMAGITAADNGMSVTILELKKSVSNVVRACSAQLVLDDGYESECIKLEDDRIVFTKNGFSVPYTGKKVMTYGVNYISADGSTVRFRHADGRPSSIKIDKKALLLGLEKLCYEKGVEIITNCAACRINDDADGVSIVAHHNGVSEFYAAKKLIIAEGVGARLTGSVGLNKGRTLFGTPFIAKYILKGVKGIETDIWNQYCGNAYHPFAELMIGPSIEGDDAVEVTVPGVKQMLPEVLFQKMLKESPLAPCFKDAKIIEKQGCSVKSYVSLMKPYNGNVISIGDSAAHIETIIQGAFMCGYHAALAVKKELAGEDGFAQYTQWWQKAFEFNRMEGIDFVKYYGALSIKAKFTDDEVNYLYALVSGNTLRGEFSQFEVPKHFWKEVLKYADKIKAEKPQIYEKMQPVIGLNLD